MITSQLKIVFRMFVKKLRKRTRNIWQFNCVIVSMTQNVFGNILNLWIAKVMSYRLFAIPVYADPRYEACRNWFYGVFNNFWVCWIQCRVVPSSTIYAKARILRFKIVLENLSKTKVLARTRHTCMPALYVIHGMRRAKNNFTMF